MSRLSGDLRSQLQAAVKGTLINKTKTHNGEKKEEHNQNIQTQNIDFPPGEKKKTG